MSTGADARIPWLSARVKSALLWGAVGALSFLVLVQGYALLIEPLLTIAQGGMIALGVGFAAAAGTYLLEGRLAAWSARRGAE